MKLECKSKKINLVYRTKKIVNVTKELGGKNFEELYFNAVNENNVEALSIIILSFAEDINSGLPYFEKIDEVFDFLDDYMNENKKTYQDIFKEVAESINEMGFFNKKMTTEELIEKMENHISVDMNKVIRESTEKAIVKVAESEMKISRG